MDGFGEKSFENLMTSLDKAKETTLAKVIYSLGIANIGLANAKVICRHFDDDLEKIRQDIEDRDYRDMHRETSPLKQAADAVLVDTSDMTIEQVIDRIVELIG